jgi:hypothetical protein
MKKFLKNHKFYYGTALCFLSGCVHLESISLTSFPQKRDSIVQAKESEMIYFGFVTNNDFVDDIAHTLAGQCQGGRIQGILTKHYTTTYVPWLVKKRTIDAKGFCSLQGGPG